MSDVRMSSVKMKTGAEGTRTPNPLVANQVLSH